MRNTGKSGSIESRTLAIIALVRRAVPEPEVLNLIGEESQHKGTNELTSRQINQVINAIRRQRRRAAI